MQILYIPNNCSTTGHVSFLVWGNVRAMASKLISKDALHSWLGTSGASVYLGVSYSQATLGLLKPIVRKPNLDYSSFYLLGLEDQFIAMEDAVVHLDTFWISSV